MQILAIVYIIISSIVSITVIMSLRPHGHFIFHFDRPSVKVCTPPLGFVVFGNPSVALLAVGERPFQERISFLQFVPQRKDPELGRGQFGGSRFMQYCSLCPLVSNGCVDVVSRMILGG